MPPATRSSKQPLDPSLVAVFQRGDAGMHALLVRIDGGRLRVVETRSFGAEERAGAGSFVADRGVSRVLVVVPANRLICRACALPDAAPDRVRAALQLQAEAHLAGAVPAHRLAMGVLPAPADAEGRERGRIGLLVGWPESGEPVPMPIDPAPPGVPVRFIGDVAALAGLMDRHRPEEPLLWIDRAEGSVAMAVVHASGIAFRCTREESEAADSWHRNISRALGETLLSVGEPATSVRDGVAALEARLQGTPSAALLCPDELRRRVVSETTGAPDDPAWWNRFGVALGAARCAAGELASLATMRAQLPREAPTPGQRIAAVLSQPRTSMLLAALGLVVIALGPLAIARMRAGVLRMKAPDLASLRAENDSDARRRAMYGELRRQTWPMSKLLADLSNCTPEGIDLTSVLIDSGQGITVQGRARPHGGQTGADRLVVMTEQMARTGIFNLPRVEWKADDARGEREFRIVSSVRDPFRNYRYAPEEDFAVDSLAVRRYGEAAREPGSRRTEIARGADAESAAAPGGAPGEATPEGAGASERVASGGSASGSGGPARRAGDRPSGRRGGEPAEGDAPPGDPVAGATEGGGDAEQSGERPARPDGRAVARRGDSESGRSGPRADRGADVGPPIPDAMTDAQISAMTKSEAQDALRRVAMARGREDLDDETRERLRIDFDRLLRRTREAQ